MPMSDEMPADRKKAYREGGKAQRAGKPRSAVPYDRGTEEEPNVLHDDWQDGYSAAEVGTHDAVPTDDPADQAES